ncbi:MAG: YfeK family protein [Desulfocapsaceae bacterium]|nr:YfeK family protein [Desulfocapsaceae bacterium]
MRYLFRHAFHLVLFFVFFCMIVLSGARAHAMPSYEEARINAMLTVLEKRSDVVFIRNGNEYTAVEAAAHLRLKLDKARNRVDTAEEFIDKAGSSSSFSGKPYLVREPGKEALPANAFLHRLLKPVNK